MRRLWLVLIISCFCATGRSESSITNLTTGAKAAYAYELVPTGIPPPSTSGTKQGMTEAGIGGSSEDHTISASAFISGSATLSATADLVHLRGSGLSNAVAPHGPFGPYAGSMATMSFSMDITLTQISSIVFSAQSIDVTAPGGNDRNWLQTMIQWYGNMYGVSGPMQGYIWGFSQPEYQTGTHTVISSWLPSQLPAGLYHFSVDATLMSFNDYDATMPSMSTIDFQGQVAVIPEPCATVSTLAAATFLAVQRRRQLV
jgi:hypothetical protein